MATTRVLLVEDSPTYTELASVLLSRCGCDVRAATTATEALRLAVAEPPELILLDINLPGASGFDVGRALRAEAGIGTPVLLGMTAADVSDADERAARAAGFDGITTKPYLEPDFRRLLGVALDPHRRRRGAETA
jgi:CheY-like chemotaxis protein